LSLACSRGSRSRQRAPTLLLALLAATQAACSHEAELVVRFVKQPGVPLAGVEITALPVNPDALLDSLAAAARTPRPFFPDLERAMAGFREGAGQPDSASARQATAAWQAVRDSLEALGGRLRAMDRASLAYREAYGRLRALYDHLGQRAAERDRALQAGLGSERQLARQAEQAADSLRRWEQVAYADFPARLETAVRQSGRDLRQAPTDSAGLARFTLPPGRWWIQARVRDPGNPFLERYWNLPLTLTRLVPVAVPLGERSVLLRWRH
jgi:hypothetical protein